MPTTISPTISRLTISAAMASKLLEEAQAKANEIGVPAVVVVVDESGVLKALARMDGAPLMSLQVAEDKAYSAAGLGLPTDQWHALVKDDPAFGYGLAKGVDRLCPLGGGYPIVIDGSVVGGIGVSGGSYTQDMEIASSALSVLA
jgi:uncharacterized protein GlcG (DUF336 family)